MTKNCVSPRKQPNEPVRISAAGLRRRRDGREPPWQPRRAGGGRPMGGDVGEARPRAVATQEAAAAPGLPPSTRTRDICITAGVVVGIFLVVGVIVAIDPFS